MNKTNDLGPVNLLVSKVMALELNGSSFDSNHHQLNIQVA